MLRSTHNLNLILDLPNFHDLFIIILYLFQQLLQDRLCRFSQLYQNLYFDSHSNCILKLALFLIQNFYSLFMFSSFYYHLYFFCYIIIKFIIQDMHKAPELEEHYFDQKMDQSDEICNEELERQKENEAVEYTKVKLRDLFPLNFLSEKEKFFDQNCNYNPHFLYKTIVYPQPVNLNVEYKQLALKILKNSPPYETNTPYLSEQQVRKKIDEYLELLGLKQYVQIKMEFECLSRTSVSYFKNKAVLKIRTPLSYTSVNLEGVLNHEIGTHILRMLNHRENCVRKPSDKGKIIQEGLASLNQLLPQQKPFLFKPALRYLAAIYASNLSFSDVYKKINKFLPDRDECWRQCVRVKRGIGNTEQKGGFYKDQNYFVGAIQVLKNRKSIDFQKIYYGRLAPEQTKNLTQGVLPPFLDTPDKLKTYKKKLEKIALCNFIDEQEQSLENLE